MNMFKNSLIRHAITVLALVVVLLIPAATALAGGNGSYTYTQTYQNATDEFVQPLSCTNGLADITITYNGVFHYTVDKAGDFWGTGTQTGTVLAIPLDPSQPTYTGHFTIWFGENDNLSNSNSTSTFSVHATGSDGSTMNFQEVAHYSVNANGVLTVNFDNLNCQ